MAGERFYGLVGRSEPMRELYRRCTELARTDGPVWITGETGVGKSGIARLIHARGPRRDHPLVCLSAVGSEPETFSWDLARAAREAGDGVLWIDEAGDLSSESVAALLALCDPPEAPGLLATTQRSLPEPIRRRFAHRIVRVPTLRERPEDVPLLAVHFLCRFTRQYRKDLRFPDREVLDRLATLPWPGNVRELANEIEHAVVLTPEGGQIGWQAFSHDLRKVTGSTSDPRLSVAL